MERQLKSSLIASNEYLLETSGSNGMDYILKFFSKADTDSTLDINSAYKKLFQPNILSNLVDLLARFATAAGKKSFLVFRNNKYLNVPTETIAFFYVKYESPVIMCFNKEEYFVNYSLEQIEQFLPDNQFFRLNRQYLINFNAIKDVEHYFARKLLVNTIIPINNKLLVSKEKVSSFLQWLDNR